MKMHKKLISYIAILLVVLLSISGQHIQCVAEQQVQQVKMPIIMYHSTVPTKHTKYNVSPKQLESDFKYILNRGYTPVFVEQVIDFCVNKTPLPSKPIVISFDDAYFNNYLHAFPLIKKYSIKTVFSVVGKYADDNYQDGVLKPTLSHLSYQDLREMVDSGLVELANHTYDLHKIKGSRMGVSKVPGESNERYTKMLTEDLKKSQEAMLKNMGINMNIFTYPYGRFNPITIDILKQLGFKAALSCLDRVNVLDSNTNLYKLGRFNRPSGPSSKNFFDKIFAKC
jgi:peptidoglycan/xylan/chitin deacetylase (PgdA/CDA1 family)